MDFKKCLVSFFFFFTVIRQTLSRTIPIGMGGDGFNAEHTVRTWEVTDQEQVGSVTNDHRGNSRGGGF